jgi:hypothetical protein
MPERVGLRRTVCHWTILVFAAALVATPRPEAAQGNTPKHAILAGYVRDEFGHPVTLATVMVEGSTLSTTSNDSGFFQLRDVPAARDVFTAMRIGYAPISFEIVMPPDSAVYTDIRLRSVVNVEKMTVTDKATPIGLMKVGFAERQRSTMGQFVTPEMIEKMPMATSTASILRQVQGLDVRCPRRLGGGCSVSSAHGECLSLWIDGHYSTIRGEDLDDAIPISGVYAIEVYPRSLQVPSQFQRNRYSKPCGAIVLWTTINAR